MGLVALVACSDGQGGPLDQSPDAATDASATETLDARIDGSGGDADAAVPMDAGSSLDATLPSTEGGTASDGGPVTDSAVIPDAATLPRETLVFVAGNSMVEAFSLNTTTGALTSLGKTELGPNPSYLVASSDGHFLYAANESDGNPGVTVATISSTGTLTKLNQRPYGGSGHKGLVYVTLDPSGKYLLAADYNGGHAAVFPVQQDGTLGEAVDDEAFGGSANTHSVRVHRSGKWAYVPNKGLDAVAQFAFDSATGKLTPLTPPTVASADGARHIALHPTKEYAYVINENDATLRAFSIASGGQLSQIDADPTLPAGFSGTNAAAHVLVHPNGGFAYASNRGHDHIAVFAIGGDGTLSQIDDTQTVAKPRDFDVAPRGDFLIAAGQDSGSLAVYTIGDDGRLMQQGQPIETVSGPACVLILERDAD